MIDPRDTELLDAGTPGAIERAAQILRSGGLVGFPTETVYGLGARGFDAQACAGIFEAKGRPAFDPLILHISDFDMLAAITTEVTPLERELAERFWPGPLTMVLPRSANVPDIVTSDLPSVAVRMPSHPVALALIALVGEPLAAPSANPFGKLSPTTACHVAAGLSGRIDAILDGGPSAVGVESTIVDLSGETPALLRAGAVPAEDLEAAVGGTLLRRLSSSRPAAPGQLESHYAPRMPLYVAEPGGDDDFAHTALLTLRWQPGDERFAVVEELSASGDLREAAAGFFAALHRLDESGVSSIVARPMPEEGLGAAIMDRLRRAAADSGH
jgi:L-threonylcarbamoyladenylate synthase